MAYEKPLTKSDLVAALKELRKQVRDDAFEDRTEFYARMTKPAIEELGQELRAEMKAGFKQVDSRLEKLEADVTFVKRDVGEIKSELSVTSSKGELNQLKQRVEKLERHLAIA